MLITFSLFKLYNLKLSVGKLTITEEILIIGFVDKIKIVASSAFA